MEDNLEIFKKLININFSFNLLDNFILFRIIDFFGDVIIINNQIYFVTNFNK